MKNNTPQDTKEENRLSFLSLLKNILRIFVGIQNSEDSDKIFQSARPSLVIIIALLFVVTFVISIITLVNVVVL